MTRYTVLWDQDVESQFIRAWVASDSSTRGVLTEVANWVDSSLAADPEQQGRPLDALDARMALVPLTSSAARVVVTSR